MKKQIIDFLRESNAIEDVWDKESLETAKKAWEYVVGQDELNTKVILKTHKILMSNHDLEEKYKGKFRDCAVYIGGREGKPWFALPELIAQWVKNIKNREDEDDIKQDHIKYEDIHPFIDGNGRTGRIFLNWQRVKAGLPILVIKADERWDYYRWFQ